MYMSSFSLSTKLHPLVFISFMLLFCVSSSRLSPVVSISFLFSRPLSFLGKHDNLTYFSSSPTHKGVSVENSIGFALCSLTNFIFHSILTRKLSLTPFQKLVISFPSHSSPHSSPRQRPLRAPRTAFGQRLEAGNLQDLAL